MINVKFNKLQYEELLSRGKNISNCVVDPLGKYAYITNIVEDEVYRIDIETGKWITIPFGEKLFKDKIYKQIISHPF